MADVKVKDVMTHLVVMLYPKDTIHDAALRLARNRISGAPVVEDGRVVGIVSESDLIHAAAPPAKARHGGTVAEVLAALTSPRRGVHLNGTTVLDIISSAVIDISPEASVWRAAELMEDKGVKRLPVVDEDGYLVGIISRADLVKAMAKSDDVIRADVAEAIGILGEDCFKNLTIAVEDGVATLSGTADRRSTRDLAVKLTGRTPGVIEVVDRLEYVMEDSMLTRSIGIDPRHDWVVDPADKAWR
jgi:CBS domain-containing protein